MAFTTVGDIITQVRVLLQDMDADGYRYDEPSLYQALNEALLETQRTRPDFYRGMAAIPQYAPSDAAATLAYPDGYKPALVDYVCGRAQLRDAEESTDQRASVFITAFRRLLSSA